MENDKVELVKEKFNTAIILEKDFVLDGSVSLTEMTRDRITAVFSAYIWAENIPIDTKVISYPATWKDAIKERFLPKFLWKCFGKPKYRIHVFSVKALYPKFKMMRPTEECIIHGLDRGETVIKKYMPSEIEERESQGEERL